MKSQIMHSVVSDGVTLKTFETLKEAESFQSNLKFRQTGRTTRLIFRALAADSNIVFVCLNRHSRREIYTKLMVILTTAYPCVPYSTIPDEEIQLFNKRILFKHKGQNGMWVQVPEEPYIILEDEL